jgi:hypothetical protein
MHLFSPDKSTKGTQTRPTICVSALAEEGCESGAVCGHWRGFAQHYCDLLQTLVSDGTHTELFPAAEVAVAPFLKLDFFHFC